MSPFAICARTVATTRSHWASKLSAATGGTGAGVAADVAVEAGVDAPGWADGADGARFAVFTAAGCVLAADSASVDASGTADEAAGSFAAVAPMLAPAATATSA